MLADGGQLVARRSSIACQRFSLRIYPESCSENHSLYKDFAGLCGWYAGQHTIYQSSRIWNKTWPAWPAPDRRCPGAAIACVVALLLEGSIGYYCTSWEFVPAVAKLLHTV